VQDEHNASYIAACAGTAEAGWRSTIAAIDLMLAAIDLAVKNGTTTNHILQPAIESIIAAWEDSL
jgi:hypothetical protein